MQNKINETEFDQIAEFVGACLQGAPGIVKAISTKFPPHENGSISFCTDLNGNAMPATDACLVIAKPDLCDELLGLGYSVIASDFPKFDLARTANNLLVLPRQALIHPTAVVGASVSLGNNVSIGAGAVLQGEITIGDDCEIGANVCLLNKVALSNGVTILNGGVIGENPYSFGFGPGHVSERFPATGGVIIEDNVEIGNNVVISRGVHDNTILSTDCRVNDLAHIGNAVTIGPRSLIMANCDVSARVVIGRECWIGQSSVLIQAVRVGDRAQIGAGALVTRDIPNDVVAYGSPAKPQGARKNPG